MSQQDLKHSHKELRALLGKRFSTDSAVRDAHARDASYHRGTLPDAVAFPKTNAEAAEIVKVCGKYKMPIVPTARVRVLKVLSSQPKARSALH